MHAISYSKDAEADRTLLRDVLGFPHIDAGGGHLMFRLPPAEAAVRPSDENDRHEIFLMCDDVEAVVSALAARGGPCDPFSTPGWGKLTRIHLPGGGSQGLYLPRHARP